MAGISEGRLSDVERAHLDLVAHAVGEAHDQLVQIAEDPRDGLQIRVAWVRWRVRPWQADLVTRAQAALMLRELGDTPMFRGCPRELGDVLRHTYGVGEATVKWAVLFIQEAG